MKIFKIIITILFLLFFINGYSTSKKRQILALNNRIDSLRAVMIADKNACQTQTKNLEESIRKLNLKITEFEVKQKKLADSLALMINSNVELKNKNKLGLKKIVQLNNRINSLIDSLNYLNPDFLLKKIKDSINLTIIFTLEKGDTFSDIAKYGNVDSFMYAVPIALYKEGKYIEIPYCEYGTYSEDCSFLNVNVKPFVLKGKELFSINKEASYISVKSIDNLDHGLSDWSRPSAIVNTCCENRVLTNNPFLGFINKKKVNSSPVFKPIKNPYGGFLSTKLIGKVDIDLDGYEELIYMREEYEGHYFEIYSFKNNKWLKVYSGGYYGV
jgi:hypothetical protein